MTKILIALKKVFLMLFSYFMDGTRVLKNNPSWLDQARAKGSYSKVNRDLNLGTNKWDIKV